MTITEMHQLFDIISDKEGIPYFTDDEKDLLLNRAQIETIRELLPDQLNPNAVNVETSSIVFDNVEDLVYEVSGINTSSGELTKATINTALQAASGDSEDYWLILNVSYDGKPCKHVRHNDWYKFQANDFKTASADVPQYRGLSSKLVFLPVDDTASIGLTLLKNPVEVDLGTVTNCELPDSMHTRVVAIGLEFAGISARDEALMQIDAISR